MSQCGTVRDIFLWEMPALPSDEDSTSLPADIADTVELSRRLLEILSKSDPAECEEELKKLKEELNARSE